jgi:hypothetical protein
MHGRRHAGAMQTRTIFSYVIDLIEKFALVTNKWYVSFEAISQPGAGRVS